MRDVYKFGKTLGTGGRQVEVTQISSVVTSNVLRLTSLYMLCIAVHHML